MTPNDLLRAMLHTFSVTPAELAECLFVSEDTMKAYLRKSKSQSAHNTVQQVEIVASAIRKLADGKPLIDSVHMLCDELDKWQSAVSLAPLIKASLTVDEKIAILCEVALLPVDYQQDYINDKVAVVTQKHAIELSETILSTDPEGVFMTTRLPDGSLENVKVLVSFRVNDTGKEYVVYCHPNAPVDENGDVDIFISNVVRGEDGVTLNDDLTEAEYQNVLRILDELSTPDENATEDPGGMEDTFITHGICDVNERYTMTANLNDGETIEMEVLLSFKFNDSEQEYVIYTDPRSDVDENGLVEIAISNVHRNGAETVLRDVTDSQYIRILEVLRALGMID